MTTEVLECVTRGAEMLDRQRPEWYREIDMARLNIASGKDCICGQLFGDYGVGARELGVTGEPHNYGFTGGAFRPIPELNEAWREAVANRILAAMKELVPA